MDSHVKNKKFKTVSHYIKRGSVLTAEVVCS